MLEIVACEQGTEEWLKARVGTPSASMFATILAKGRNGSPSETRKKYLYQLVAETITGEPSENFKSQAMDRGHLLEAEARNLYAFNQDVSPEMVGFVRNGRKGCSPDAFVGEDGGLEIKTKAGHLLVECILRADAPPEHKAQIQGCLWVCERDWWDLAIYWPNLPLVIHRITRDETYIANLSSEVDRFNDELDALVERVRRYGQPEARAA